MTASNSERTIRIATRASSLAMWQAEHVAGLLAGQGPDVSVEIVKISTRGDRDLKEPLHAMGGQGVFTREVQNAVLDGRCDVAVHSLKDLPTQTVAGLCLAGIPVRAARFDALVLPAGAESGTFEKLPNGARIGTGSLRRRAQLLHVRDDLEMLEVRGNVETRLRKLDEGEYDALIMAVAGLERLGLQERISQVLEPPLMLPAVGQAALGIECRADDAALIEMLTALSDPITRAEVVAERACLATLRAGCHAPVGTLTKVDTEARTLSIDAVVLSADGTQRVDASETGSVADADLCGQRVADQLRKNGADALLAPESDGD
ncbi:hydroxymethylbilane synthase [Maioricimonas sp. JC845]|uniref:hydroxymethylbilane synthase n=1 Tax=Maioricimonas sp. JC845 TaxID=3232138 RepID=UPI0034582AFC